MKWALLIASTALASAVEMVEALTIVLATGITRGWRAALTGVGLALAALAVLVAVFGPLTATLVPLGVLRLVIGALLLVFGLQWLRKAILRAAGRKAQHDEDAIYAAEVAALQAGGPATAQAFDWTGFTVSFKGVFLEGLEVVFIVVTFGASAGSIGVAAAGAGLAAAVVLIVGLLAHRPLSQVPENALKFAVGLLLTTFGAFWAGEGVGIKWPGGDLALAWLLVGYGLLAWLLVATLREPRRDASALAASARGGGEK